MQRSPFLQILLPFDTQDPQPVAHMLEKNKEQFPGFAGDGIKSKIHEFDGAHYYTAPVNYVHYLIGSMTENLINKGGFPLKVTRWQEITNR